MYSWDRPEDRISILQINSELRHAQLELISAHCATHQLRLRFNAEDIARFGQRGGERPAQAPARPGDDRPAPGQREPAEYAVRGRHWMTVVGGDRRRFAHALTVPPGPGASTADSRPRLVSPRRPGGPRRASSSAVGQGGEILPADRVRPGQLAGHALVPGPAHTFGARTGAGITPEVRPGRSAPTSARAGQTSGPPPQRAATRPALRRDRGQRTSTAAGTPRRTSHKTSRR